MKKLFTLLLLGFFKTCVLDAQIMNSVVGNGFPTYSGDGGQATAAGIYEPMDGIMDANGNMYITTVGDNRVRKITPGGIITTLAGNGTTGYTGDGGSATAASLNFPIGIAIDAAGNVYISDDGNNVIRKVDTITGIITTVVGTGIAGFSGDGGPATAAKLNSQNGISFDAAGNLYIADGSNNRIRKVNTSGIISTIAGTGVGNFNGDGGQATATNLSNPANVVLDGAGNIYVSDQNNYRIRKINIAGIVTTVAGNGISGYSGDGGQATSAEIDATVGVDVDAPGNLYIYSVDDSYVRKVNTAGIIKTIAGTGTPGYNGNGYLAIYEQLNYPCGVFLDVSGNLYVADRYNDLVRIVTNAESDADEAGVTAIISPVNGCNDSLITPLVTIENYGTNTLTSCLLYYFMDNGTVQTYTWTGSLSIGQTTNINLPSYVAHAGGHNFGCYCYAPNNNYYSNYFGYEQVANFIIAFGTNLPITESFDTIATLPDSKWSVGYLLSGGTTFSVTTNAYATGTKSCMIDNINNVAGNISNLQTNSLYDLTTMLNPVLTFKAAYQQKSTSNTDKLQILVSTDCGYSWQVKKTITSAVLASLSGGISSMPYVPTPAQFTTYTVNINSVSSNNNVMFRWEFLADPTSPGNNLYIDDIDILYSASGIETIDKSIDLSIYPNPSNGSFIIETNTNAKQTVQIYDINGRIVLIESINNKASIDVSSLPNGIYNVSILSNEGPVNKRIVIAH